MFGKAAGPIRNIDMAKIGNTLIAIWDGRSKGTLNMIKVAEKRGLKVMVFRVDGGKGWQEK